MENNIQKDIQYNLGTPSFVFFNNLRRSLFNLQSGERGVLSITDINNFHTRQHVVQMHPEPFTETEYNALVDEHKIWCRQRVLSDIIEESILLFKIHAFWLEKVNHNMGVMLSSEYQQHINKLLTTQTSMISAITTLEEKLKTNINSQFKSFLIALYKIRNSIIHHQGFSIKSEIELPYVINSTVVSDKKSTIYNIDGIREIAIKDILPYLDGGEILDTGIKPINHKITISESEYINISYEQTMDIIIYFHLNMRRIVSNVNQTFKNVLASDKSPLSTLN